jgi:glycosyltransferase involved in cell wall biosynthesis
MGNPKIRLLEGAGSRLLRVCLITPGHASTNPRLVKEADALVAAGYSVRVVSCEYLRWAREADFEYRTRPWWGAGKVRFGPLAPLTTRLKQYLRQRIGRMRIGRGSMTEAAVNAAWHPAGPDLIRAAARVEADLYVAHYPTALPAAANAARLHGALYAFDAEDFHLGDAPEKPEFDFSRKMIRAIEARYLPGAAYVTASSPEIADAYVHSYGIAKPKVILNVFSVASAPPSPSRRGAAVPGPSLYWFSQTIGPDRGLEGAVEAISRARSVPHLYLIGQLAAGYEKRLREVARGAGCESRLHLLPPSPPSELVHIAAQFDVGLASETGHTPNNSRALSNKLFTYLLAGVPVLASDTPAQARFAASAPSCVTVYPRNDPNALAAALDDWLLRPDRLAQAREAAFALGRTRYNWEIESAVLLDLVRRVFSSRQESRTAV